MCSGCRPLLGLRTRSFSTWCRLLGRALHARRRRLCARWLNFALRLRTLYLGLDTLWLLHRPLWLWGRSLRCYLRIAWWLLQIALRFDRPLRGHVVVRLYRLRWAYVVVETGPILPRLIDSRAIYLRPVYSWLVWLVETLSVRPWLIDSGAIHARLVHSRPVRSRLIDSWAIHLRPVDAGLVDSRAIESPGLVSPGPDGGLHTGGTGKGCLCRTSVVFIEELLPVL